MTDTNNEEIQNTNGIWIDTVMIHESTDITFESKELWKVVEFKKDEEGRQTIYVRWEKCSDFKTLVLAMKERVDVAMSRLPV